MPIVKTPIFKGLRDDEICDSLCDQLDKTIGFKRIYVDSLEFNCGVVSLCYSILNYNDRDNESEIMDNIEVIIRDLGGDNISQDRYAIGKYFIIFSVF